MKRTHQITLGFMLLLFIGCGGGSTTTPSETQRQDVPKSPVLNAQEKVPPAVPKI